MANKKITQLASGSANIPLSGSTAVVYNGTTYQQTISSLRQNLVDSGSHHFTGSQYINGNLIVTGSIIAQEFIISSSVSHITVETVSGSSNFGDTFDDNHNFTGSVNVTGSLNVKGNTRFSSLLVGTASFQTDNPEVLSVANSGSFNVAHFDANNQYYAQINLKNWNSGNNSSGDIVVTADNGNEGIHYVDLGINSSTYTGGLVGAENDAYLLNVGNDLYIGTVGGGFHPGDVRIFTQNSWQEPQISVSGSGQIMFNTGSVANGFEYEFSGSVKLDNQLKVDGSVTASYFVGDGSHLTNLPVQTTNVSMFLSSSAFNTFYTSSYLAYSSSLNSRLSSLESYSDDDSYFATTGSNTFVGDQTVHGIIYNNNIHNIDTDLNIIAENFNNIGLWAEGGTINVTGSLLVSGSQVIQSVNPNANYVSKFAGYVGGAKMAIGVSSDPNFGVTNDILNGDENGYSPYTITAESITINAPSTFNANIDTNGNSIRTNGGDIRGNNFRVDNILTLGATSERFTVTDGASVPNAQPPEFDYTYCAIAYVSNYINAIDIKLINVPEDSNRALGFTVILDETTNKEINSFVINNEVQSILWFGGSQPDTIPNVFNIFSFSMLRISGTWKVFGQLTTF